jgi:hypothetical protein
MGQPCSTEDLTIIEIDGERPGVRCQRHHGFKGVHT